MHTSRRVSSITKVAIPVLYHTHVSIANIIPPITGDGIQNFSRNLILYLRKVPKTRTMTAIARVWYILSSIVIL